MLLSYTMSFSWHCSLQAALSGFAPVDSATEQGLAKTIVEAVASQGKLMRGELCAQCAWANDLKEEQALQLAVAVEYFHAASLLLDDLPCMDNARERRGVACAHMRHGEASTILASIALINQAFHLVWGAMAEWPYALREQAQACLHQCLGHGGLLNGQARDLAYHKLAQPSSKRVSAIAHQKTGALIRMALLLPAILGGASTQEQRLLSRLALCWGLLYQHADDLKDVCNTAAATGKTPGRDAAMGRPNILSSMSLGQLQQRLERLSRFCEEAFGSLIAEHSRWMFLETMNDAMASRALHTEELLSVASAIPESCAIS